ncbi:MAG TPA: hypothetical protein PLV31_05780 [Gammaproteobacteria bacterium]|nr:hypothetical protein [Gammaproteobacteria bacterium]HRA43173.1 hypothetical protein [Gammaproteobacteria bacterium]
MAEYLTEVAYQRWLRQYKTNLGSYINLLDDLRIQLDALSYEVEVSNIENRVSEIDENLEKVIPRNFSPNARPLQGFEMFVENIKVLINLFYRMRGRQDYFKGIYELEKNRVLAVHHEFQFKEKLKRVREMIEAIELQSVEEITEEKSINSSESLLVGSSA